jgi:precorrin-6B methylase 2
MKRLALLSLTLASAPLHADEAADILTQSGVKGGIVVHVGCGDGSITQKLRANDSYQVQGLATDPAVVPALRESVAAAGSYGPISIDSWAAGKHLPYIENYVNLLVIEDAAPFPKRRSTAC